MIRFRKPTTEQLERYLAEQASRELNYPAVGMTRAGSTPPGFRRDHHRVRLGSGELAFEAACEALRKWRHFELGWIDLYPPSAPLQTDQPVAVVAHVLGCHVLNACRIVYRFGAPTIEVSDGGVSDGEASDDEAHDQVKRFGFAYGALPDHAEAGEERFTIEWRKDDDSVWYDLLADSRPNRWFSWLAYPLTRRLQKRFAGESLAAMKSAVERAVARTNAAVT